MRVVVLGGLGNFGARICRSLSEDESHEIIAAGRYATQSAGTITVNCASVRTAQLDIQADDFPDKLAKLQPGLVIHCAGPFQGQDYRVAESACAVGAHYVDLSDGRRFVANFAKCLDTRARAAEICAISGASSVPALSSAVTDMLAARYSRVDSISMAIAPGQQAPRGTATLKAVFSYAGSPIGRLKDGVWQAAHGWQDLRVLRFPGLGTRWAAACDVPDLELFPLRYPSVRTVEFHAALELRIQHMALWLAAAMRRRGMRIPLERSAPWLNRVSISLLDRFGSENGGMLVKVTGIRLDGTAGASEWHLCAPDRSGPEIPCMAAILVARKILAGELTARGAFACTGFLHLSEFGPLFHRWGIRTTIEES